MFNSKFKAGNKYRFIHFLTGSIIGINTKYTKNIIIIVVLYQSLQYIFNIRLFLIEKKIEKQNSLNHTLNKLLDYWYGFLFIKILNLIRIRNKIFK